MINSGQKQWEEMWFDLQLCIYWGEIENRFSRVN